jgi:hypothetical protein
MSKLLNLIAYSLVCLLTYTNWVLSYICERLAKHMSRIIVAHLEMVSILFIYVCLPWDRSSYTCGDFAQIATSLNLISSSLIYVYYPLMVSFWGLTLVFVNLGTMVEYSCLNTCLYTLWSTLISCIVSHASLGLCLMNSLPRGGENVHKVGRTLLLTRWLREETW